MMNITITVLKQALADDSPVIIVYDSKGVITQRRIYVRSMDHEFVTAYCLQKKGIRKFRVKNILSAFSAEV